MPKVVHFELSAEDTKRSMKFYEAVFGWKFQGYGDQDYWLTMAGEKGEPGIGGAIQKRKMPGETVVNTIGVTNLDETIKKIEMNGGKIIVPKMEIPKVGLLVYFMDTEGVVQGAIQMFPDAMMM